MRLLRIFHRVIRRVVNEGEKVDRLRDAVVLEPLPPELADDFYPRYALVFVSVDLDRVLDQVVLAGKLGLPLQGIEGRVVGAVAFGDLKRRCVFHGERRMGDRSRVVSSLIHPYARARHMCVSVIRMPLHNLFTPYVCVCVSCKELADGSERVIFRSTAVRSTPPASRLRVGPNTLIYSFPTRVSVQREEWMCKGTTVHGYCGRVSTIESLGA